MSTNVTVLIDSRDRSDDLGGQLQWSERDLSQSDPYTCLGNSWAQPETRLGTLKDLFSGNFSFDGTALSLYGFVERTALVSAGNISFKATIDGDIANVGTHDLILASDSLAAQRVWYRSPILQSGQHLVFLSELPWEGVYIDYITLGTGLSTSVNGKSIAIDEGDSVISYTGQWKTFTGLYLAVNLDGNPYNYATPYGSSTHVSNTVGDAVQIPFTGSSVNIYGFLRWNITGSISLRFALDNEPSEDKTFPVPGTSKPKPDTLVETNYLFYSQSSLSPGDHILQINVTEVVGDFVFDLDMVLYKASYDTPQTLPTITIPPLRLQASESQKYENVKPIIGAIVGGIVGGVLVLSIVVRCFLHRRRHSLKETDVGTVEPFYLGSTTTTSPPPSGRFPLLTILSWSPFVGGIFGTREEGKRERGDHSQGRSLVQPQAPAVEVTAGDTNRYLEIHRHLEELERESEILQERRADPPPYEPGQASLGEVIARNRIRSLELRRQLDELRRENEILQERQGDPPPYVPGSVDHYPLRNTTI